MTERRKFMFTCLVAPCLLAPAWAQETPTYARAFYTKTKPGQQKAADEINTAAEKGARAVVENGKRLGYVRLRRVHPSTAETGYDFVWIQYFSGPPDLDAQSPPEFWQATGMSRDQFLSKRNDTSNLVKSEIWRQRASLGSIHTGDFIRATFVKPKRGMENELRERDTQVTKGALEQVMKAGAPLKGWSHQAIWFGGSGDPYALVRLSVYARSEDLFTRPAPQEEMFRKAHPGLSFQNYLEHGRALIETFRTEIFKVEQAIWKNGAATTSGSR